MKNISRGKIVEEHPDSALSLISSIDTAQLRTDKARALYYLLKTQSEFKNYIFKSDFEPMASAQEYFSTTGNSSYNMRAFGPTAL